MTIKSIGPVFACAFTIVACHSTGLDNKKPDGAVSPDRVVGGEEDASFSPPVLDAGDRSNVDTGLGTASVDTIPPAGILTGYGGDGLAYTTTWQSAGLDLKPIAYPLQGTTFFRFVLDGMPWPSADWAVRSDSWRVTCRTSGVVSGIGGDGKVYTEAWIGSGRTLQPVPHAQGTVTYFSFTLDGKAWPSSDWGIRMDSWTIVCM